MKHFKLLATIAALAMTVSSFNSNAQPPQKSNWQDKVMAEKIAFITIELQLTPEEAQVFWPVYNKIDTEKKLSQKAVNEAYKALTKALKEDSVSEKEINTLLDNYLTAKEAHKDMGKDNVKEFRKVLSGTKVAKLYVAEEDFRRNHIRNFKDKHKPKMEGRTPGPRK